MNSNQLKLVAFISSFLLSVFLLPAQDTLYFDVVYNQVYGPENLAGEIGIRTRFKCAMTRTDESLHLNLSNLHLTMMGREISLQELEGVTALNFYYKWENAHYQLIERDTNLITDALAENLAPNLLPLTVTPGMFHDNRLIILHKGEDVQYDRETLEFDSIQRTDELLSASFKIHSFSKKLWEDSLKEAKASPNSKIKEKEITIELSDGEVIITGEMVKYGKYIFHVQDNAPELIDFDRVTLPMEFNLKDPTEKLVNEFSLKIRRIRE